MQTLSLPIDEALDLDIDELAIHLLAQSKPGEMVHLAQLTAQVRDQYTRAGGSRDQVFTLRRRLAAAWQWLRNEGFIAPDSDQSSSEWEFVTDAAQGVGLNYVADRRSVGLLREAALDGELREKVLPMFRRGQYGEAVFAAMRTVEVRVRSVAGLSDGDIGVKLMHRAFGEGGPLHDPSLDPGEALGRMHLFASAISVYKNPPSHRIVNIDDAQEAAEAVLFANNLLRVVDRVEAVDHDAPPPGP